MTATDDVKYLMCGHCQGPDSARYEVIDSMSWKVSQRLPGDSFWTVEAEFRFNKDAEEFVNRKRCEETFYQTSPRAEYTIIRAVNSLNPSFIIPNDPAQDDRA